MAKRAFLILTLLLISTVSAQTPTTGSIDLAYTAPTEYTDGTAIPTGTAITYNVYMGTTAGGESATPVQTSVRYTSAVVSGLTVGTTYYFTVTAVVNGVEGPRSVEASATVPAATPTVETPAAPGGLTATGVPP
jgi:hypothetical protein